MDCKNVKTCPCPKTACANHGICCQCVKKHRDTDSLPYCIFPKDGDKSQENFYKKLKDRFEKK